MGAADVLEREVEWRLVPVPAYEGDEWGTRGYVVTDTPDKACGRYHRATVEWHPRMGRDPSDQLF